MFSPTRVVGRIFLGPNHGGTTSLISAFISTFRSSRPSFRSHLWYEHHSPETWLICNQLVSTVIQKPKRFSTLLQRNMTLASVYVWIGIFIVQPHKEERFMYVIYPLICYNAAHAWGSFMHIFDFVAAKIRTPNPPEELEIFHSLGTDPRIFNIFGGTSLGASQRVQCSHANLRWSGKRFYGLSRERVV